MLRVSFESGTADEIETSAIPEVAPPASLWLVAYDICDPGRLRRVARTLLDHGERIQWSLFSCVLTAWQRGVLAEKIGGLIDPAVDSVRFYPLRGAPAVASGALPNTTAPRYYIA